MGDGTQRSCYGQWAMGYRQWDIGDGQWAMGPIANNQWPIAVKKRIYEQQL